MEELAKARESAVGEKDLAERLAADYGLWASSNVRGELWPRCGSTRRRFLSDVEARLKVHPRRASRIA